jgi:two-component system, chemotaxis family, protein-glutamate methylesterase/glutaminase
VADKIRVLFADDTAFFRRVAVDALAGIPDVEVVAVVADGRQALDRIAQGDVQLAILDLEMPNLDGLAAAREIAKRHPTVQFALLSGVATARHAMESIAIGALELIRKPSGADLHDRLRGSLERVVEAARAVRAADERRRTRSAVPATAVPLAPAASRALAAPARSALRKLDLVLVGVSTGGPKALLELIPRLPADLPCPVIVVQHMSAGFTASLAESLARASQLPVSEAAAGEPLTSGHVLIAPGGVHLELAASIAGAPPTLRTSEAPPVNGCRPSVDVLWSSVATNFRGGVLGVVLTGMGRDGLDGVQALRPRGLHCIAQDEATSVVWGMPGAVVAAGLADEVLPLDAIAARVDALLRQGRAPAPR